MMSPETWKDRGFIVFGRVVGAHGLRGAVRVRPDNPESDAQTIARVFVERHNAPLVEYRVRSTARAGHGSLKMELEGVDTVEQAQALRGAELHVCIDDLPPAQEREFYYFQVIGLHVETTDGQSLGEIHEVFFNGSNDVWVVKGETGEVLVPVIEDVVRRIDLEQGRAIIDAIPGLLE
jgi:16S rRNA processing protein RimM